jgi:hypothetical protein
MRMITLLSCSAENGRLENVFSTYGHYTCVVGGNCGGSCGINARSYDNRNEKKECVFHHFFIFLFHCYSFKANKRRSQTDLDRNNMIR